MPEVLHRQPQAVANRLEAASKDASIISLAGAMPADELFPVASMKQALEKVMRHSEAHQALQYGWPEGKARLLRHIGLPAIVTNGAQEALFLVGRALLQEGGLLAVEVPTYASALQSFDLRRAQYLPVPRTTAGLDLEALEDAFRAGARVFYLVASGHNPTGGVLDVAAHQAILSLAEKFDAWIIDDIAYGAIVYGEAPPPLRSHGRHLDRIVEIGSYSKVLAPGLRVGWLAGPAGLVHDATTLKSAIDLETAAFTQLVLAHWLEASSIEEQLALCMPVYRRRRDALVEALTNEMPEEVAWTRPEGGFSALVTAPPEVDAAALVGRCIEAGVLIEPAAPYYATILVPGAMRLSFSNVSEEKIGDGVRRLARVLRDVLPPRKGLLQRPPQWRKT
jgi:2-aminoadipate transaminase